MKTIQRLTLCALFALCSLYANAYSFSATNSDGVLIYYSIVTSDEYEYAVSVSYNSSRYYRGTIKIPETATNNSTGRKYTVIGISSNALYWGGGVTTIELSSTISYINGRIGSSYTPRITVDEENPYFCDVDGVLFSKDMKTLVRFPPASSLLPSYDIPDSVTEIRDYAFSGCSGLTGELKIPDSVTIIGEYAFSGCSGFTGELKIPNSVNTIGEYAFNNCSGFTGELKIPDSVTTIEEGTFSRCMGLTSVVIPNNITTIGESAFKSCTGLTEVTIPNSVTSIGSYAFRECTGLTEISIPNSVTSIGADVFYKCTSLAEVSIGNSVASIGNFAFQSCTSLTSIYSLNPEPSECGSSVFSGVDKEACTLYVPIGSYRAYATAKQWKEFLNIVEMDMTGIESVIASSEDAEIVGYYTIDGKTVETPQKGVNIVKFSDGTTKKVLVK